MGCGFSRAVNPDIKVTLVDSEPLYTKCFATWRVSRRTQKQSPALGETVEAAQEKADKLQLVNVMSFRKTLSARDGEIIR